MGLPSEALRHRNHSMLHIGENRFHEVLKVEAATGVDLTVSGPLQKSALQ